MSSSKNATPKNWLMRVKGLNSTRQRSVTEEDVQMPVWLQAKLDIHQLNWIIPKKNKNKPNK